MIIMTGGGRGRFYFSLGSGEQVLVGAAGVWRSGSSPSTSSWLEATQTMADCPDSDFFNVVHEVESTPCFNPFLVLRLHCNVCIAVV